MAKDRPTDDKTQRDAAKTAAAPAPVVDERDLKIERLERALAEEKANAVSLREAGDAARFKLEILEKSYSKQLADTRQRADAASKELATLKGQIAEFGKGGEDTLKAVSEMRAELLNITAERNHLRDQLERGGGAAAKSYGSRSYAPRAPEESSDTINALITNAGLDPGRDRPRAGDSNSNQRVKLDQGPAEIMVSPDLIFTDKDKDDGEKNAA